MANEIRKILAQAKPNLNTLTDIYTVGASTQAVVSTLLVCNLISTVASFRISVAPAGAADDLSQYIYYDVNILGNDTFAATVGITLSATDIVRFSSSSGNLSISLFGVEIS